MIATQALLVTCAVMAAACARQSPRPAPGELPAHSPAVSPTYTITGQVRAPTSHAPLEGATVRVVGAPLGAISRANGTFTIRGVPPGPLRLQASLIRYNPADTTVVLAGDTSVVFALRAARVIRR